MADLTGDLTSRPIWIFGIMMMRMVSLARRPAPADSWAPAPDPGWLPPGAARPEAGPA
jgi:hypothetical protein